MKTDNKVEITFEREFDPPLQLTPKLEELVASHVQNAIDELSMAAIIEQGRGNGRAKMLAHLVEELMHVKDGGCFTPARCPCGRLAEKGRGVCGKCRA